MTTEKALKEWKYMYDETEGAEALAIQDQCLMGDACKELRLAYGLPRNAIAQKLGVDSMQLTAIEARASTNTAKKYRDAVLSLVRKK